MRFAGIDYSTQAVDIVLIDADTGQPEWQHYDFTGHDAFERCRSVRDAMPPRTATIWDDVLAIGIEAPMARGKLGRALMEKLALIQGGILACLPAATLAAPLRPPEWRVACGLKGNATKEEVARFARDYLLEHLLECDIQQDVCDAYCIARAVASQAVLA